MTTSRLAPCAACHAQISKNASTCPRWGHHQAQATAQRQALNVVVALAFAVAVVYAAIKGIDFIASPR